MPRQKKVTKENATLPHRPCGVATATRSAKPGVREQWQVPRKSWCYLLRTHLRSTSFASREPWHTPFLAKLGGCATRAFRAQTVLADCFQVRLRYSAAQKGHKAKAATPICPRRLAAHTGYKNLSALILILHGARIMLNLAQLITLFQVSIFYRQHTIGRLASGAF